MHATNFLEMRPWSICACYPTDQWSDLPKTLQRKTKPTYTLALNQCGKNTLLSPMGGFISMHWVGPFSIH